MPDNPGHPAQPDRPEPNGEGSTEEATDGPFGLAKDAEQARQALLNRPRFSLRLQIFLGNSLAFLIAVAVVATLVVSIQGVEEKTRFLEIVGDYAMEIEQARRFEKNFFLYGTNLGDALENVFKAEKILNLNAEELAAILGREWRGMMLPNLELYQTLLARLGGEQKSGKDLSQAERLKLQDQIRTQGQQMLSSAVSLLTKERAALADVLTRSRRLLLFSVALLLLFMVVNTYLLNRRMLNSITRFGNYAHRIAAGDYTPVMPSRPYRDEFTDLALTINVMIKELEKREAVLVQSHKMRAVGTLTAGVAHELNNPMNNITLTAAVLQEDYATLEDEERLEMIDDLVKEAERAKKIISNLLDFARESGSQLEPLDLPQLLRETIALAANQVKLSGIKIDFQTTGNLPRVHGDGQQLSQVFLNLLLNAIDASNKGDRIQVLVLPADEPNYVAVKVVDFGAGIPNHILPSIFDPFFTTKAKGKGTGLGLSVSQGIVAKHGGRILVNSQEGKGTTFTVVMPVTTIPAELEA